jgi:hypothetical protein
MPRIRADEGREDERQRGQCQQRRLARDVNARKTERQRDTDQRREQCGHAAGRQAVAQAVQIIRAGENRSIVGKCECARPVGA